MKIFSIIYIYSFLSASSIKVSDCDNESISHLFENDEIEFSRNVNMGILCHTYNFDKIEFYKSDTRSEFIEYLNQTKSVVTDRPTMTYASIILYNIANINILKSEVYKIMQFIISPEDSNEYPNNIKNLYKIEITKINYKKDKKDLFNKLPNFNQENSCLHEKITQNVLHIFLLEDIKKNSALKKRLRGEIFKFFFKNKEKNKNYILMKTLIIEAFDITGRNLVNYMSSRFSNYHKLMTVTNYILFIAFEILEERDSYSQNDIELSHQRDFTEEKNIFKTRFYKDGNRSTLSLYKKADAYNLDYYIKFVDKTIEFVIYKCIDTNNTYAKLLNFLGYSPLEKSYGIKIFKKSGNQVEYFFEIKVSIHKKIIKQANNQVPEVFNNIKQIIISSINYDNSYNMLIDYSYEMDANSSEGFPLSCVERETIQDKEYNKNIEAKKLINFIDFYESFVYGRHYFYFKDVYSSDIDLDNNFCFYKREIYFKYLNILKIHKIVENSLKLQTELSHRKNHKTFSTCKSIEVFNFKKEYTRNKYSIDLNNNIEVLKGFDDHHFYDIELCFYTNIQSYKYHNPDKNYFNINYFIKVDFGFNKNYFIFFREVPNNWTNKEEFYNLTHIYYQANKFLNTIMKELLCLNDDEETKKHTSNFINVIFNMIKMYLNDNIALKKNLCYTLKEQLHSFLPRTQKLIYMFLDIANNRKTQFRSREIYLVKVLFQNSIIIIKRNFKNMLFEACVLRSISNKEDHSQQILESLL